MANITNLTQFLGDIADAIRTKTKSVDTIPAAEFDTQILSIQTGIDTSDATALAENIENGYTAYVQGQKIAGTIDTSLDTYITDGPSAVITDTGEDIVVDKSYGKKVILKDTQHLRSVIPYNTLADIANITPEKILKGQTILGVKGTAEAGGGTVTTEGVKLFETIEEMQDDPTVEEGDLALVYRSEIQNATANSQFQVATFPATVILPSAMTDYAEIMYRAVDDSSWFDCWGQLDANYFSMNCYSETSNIRIEYESTDGITYTRTDGGEETIDFGTEICFYEGYGEFNEAIGYFIQVGGSTFDGLYQYNVNYATDDYTAFDIDNIDYTNNILNIPLSNIRIPNDVINGFYDKVCELEGGRTYMWMVATCDADNNLYGYISAGNSSTIPDIFIDIPNKVGYIPSMDGSEHSVSSTLIKKYKYIAATKETVLDTFNADYSVYNATYKAQKLIPDKYFLGRIYKNNMSDPITLTTIRIFGFNDISGGRITDIDMHISSGKYHIDTYVLAPTQLTLDNASQLLPGKIAYGKTGAIKGDGSIYENLDIGKLDTAYMSSLAATATTNLSINTDIPFGVRIFEPTLDPLTNEDVSTTHSMSYKNLLSEYSTDITGYILDYFIDVDNNKITTYKATALGVITEYTSDLDLNNVTTKTYSITSTEYAVAGKLVNNKFYLFTHVGGRTTSGNVYAKVLDMSTGTITSLGTVLSSVSYVSMYTAYDEISGLLYFAGGYKTHRWGIVNTNTNTLTNKESISNSVSANIAMTAETEQYVFVAFNNTLSAYKKGSTTAITVMTNCRPEHIVCAEDDTNKYTFIYNYNDSKKYYSISPKDSTSFGTFTQVNWTLPSLRIDKINGVTYYFRGVNGYDVPIDTQSNDGNVCYYLGANLFRREKYAECKYLITDDSIRVYSPESYSGQNMRLYIARNIKMKDLQQFPQENEFVGYCYDEGTVIPLTSNYTDCIIRGRKSYEGTIAPSEYNIAVKTTDTILGEEE